MTRKKPAGLILSPLLVAAACSTMPLDPADPREARMQAAFETKASCVRYHSMRGMVPETAAWIISECWRIARHAQGL